MTKCKKKIWPPQLKNLKFVMLWPQFQRSISNCVVRHAFRWLFWVPWVEWWWSDSHFVQNKHAKFTLFCVLNLVPPAQFYFATDLSVIVIRQNQNQYNTTAGVQKLWPGRSSETMALQVFRNYGTAGWFFKSVGCHSFWTPALVVYCLQFCITTITLRSVVNIEPRGRDQF